MKVRNYPSSKITPIYHIQHLIDFCYKLQLFSCSTAFSDNKDTEASQVMLVLNNTDTTVVLLTTNQLMCHFFYLQQIHGNQKKVCNDYVIRAKYSASSLEALYLRTVFQLIGF